MTAASKAARKFKGRLSQDQIEIYKEAFDHFDDDKSGSISTSELETVMRQMGQTSSDEEMRTMIQEIDVDGDGEINFEEFCEMMAKKQEEFGAASYEEELQEAFKVFDKDKDGFITFTELKNLLRQLGDKSTDADINEMIQDVASGKDNKISWNDFKSVMSD